MIRYTWYAPVAFALCFVQALIAQSEDPAIVKEFKREATRVSINGFDDVLAARSICAGQLQYQFPVLMGSPYEAECGSASTKTFVSPT